MLEVGNACLCRSSIIYTLLEAGDKQSNNTRYPSRTNVSHPPSPPLSLQVLPGVEHLIDRNRVCLIIAPSSPQPSPCHHCIIPVPPTISLIGKRVASTQNILRRSTITVSSSYHRRAIAIPSLTMPPREAVYLRRPARDDEGGMVAPDVVGGGAAGACMEAKVKKTSDINHQHVGAEVSPH